MIDKNLFFFSLSFLRATRGARNPNLQLLLRMHRMYVASISLDFR